MSRAKSYVIGIAGGSGAGKTTLINRVLERTGPEGIRLIQHDWYYRHRPGLSLAQRQQINYDHPEALDTELMISHVEMLLAGQPVDVPQYDYGDHLRRKETLRLFPGKILILDGVLILAEAALRDLIDLKVYVAADPDLRFIRRMERDIRERGRTRESVVDQYLTTVKPMHDLYVAPLRSHADIIVEGGGRSAAADLIAGKIASLLAKRP